MADDGLPTGDGRLPRPRTNDGLPPRGPFSGDTQVADAVDATLSQMAMQVHDNELQVLSAVTIGLTTLEHQISDPAVREQVSFLADQLAGAIAELRRHVMGAPAVPTSPLSQRLATVIEGLRLPDGPVLRLGLTGCVDSLADETLADDLIAVIREANSNAVRHARATSIVTAVEVGPRQVCASVSDDGVGIQSPSRISGLRNMQRRAELRGGDFSLAQRLGGGTDLRWTVPLQRDADSVLPAPPS